MSCFHIGVWNSECMTMDPILFTSTGNYSKNASMGVRAVVSLNATLDISKMID